MENPAPNDVVLASSSPYRRDLLARILSRFECVAPDLDETPHDGEAPAALSLRLAREKAAAVASRHAGATVIGADQVAVLEGRVCGKPGSRDAAVAQLLAARGLPMRFLTSVCVIHGPGVGDGGEERVHTDVTEVRNRIGRPRAASSCATAASRLPGLSQTLPSSAATWSEPMTVAPLCRDATAADFSRASRSDSAAGASPSSGVSSRPGGTHSKRLRIRASSSRR